MEGLFNETSTISKISNFKLSYIIKKKILIIEEMTLVFSVDSNSTLCLSNPLHFANTLHQPFPSTSTIF